MKGAPVIFGAVLVLVAAAAFALGLARGEANAYTAAPGAFAPLGSFACTRQTSPLDFGEELASIDARTAHRLAMPAACGLETLADVRARLWRHGYRQVREQDGAAVYEASCGRLAALALESDGTTWHIALAFGQRADAKWQQGACEAPKEHL